MPPLLLNGNTMVAVDIETTGLVAGYHDIVQLALVPVTPDLMPDRERAKVWLIRPEHPERASSEAMRINGLDLEELYYTAPSVDTVKERIDAFRGSFAFAEGKGFVPLAHNWAFENSFLRAWYGAEHFDQVFQRRARDTMMIAGAVGDLAEVEGREYPFAKGLSLEALTSHFGVVNEKAHDALFDCFANDDLYRELLLSGFRVDAQPSIPTNELSLAC